MSHDTVHNVWCATKPVLALYLAELHAAGVVDPDLPISKHVHDWSRLTEVDLTPMEILSHVRDLAQPTMFEAQMLPHAERARLAIEAASTATADATAYSEFVGWAVLDELVLELTAKTADEQLETFLQSLVPGHTGIKFRLSADDFVGP